jgi:hypothetical protein
VQKRGHEGGGGAVGGEIKAWAAKTHSAQTRRARVSASVGRGAFGCELAIFDE